MLANTVHHMHDYPENDFLSGSYLMQEYNEPLLKEMIEYFHPDNFW